ncbi:uncharacterized protein [Spinacia oleracea]|uniref:Sulfotransferase n=1 Tax=Spinacia oleracea TaxID=3562 RepID=A0ABM3QGQ3_SPIOL|nr:uncharacterized protein LOC110798223 [Spinacia oleracea]XP_056684799.1 uncharacterized protein LOC130460976 [Spinacia oleracea]
MDDCYDLLGVSQNANTSEIMKCSFVGLLSKFTFLNSLSKFTFKREEKSEVSAVRMEMSGGGVGWVAQMRDWASFVGFRPAIARVLRGEEDELRNFRDSLRTYLPVKPDAPSTMMS